MSMRTKTQSAQAVIVVGGIDSHLDTHHVVALDATGRLLGHQRFPVSLRGYPEALDWLAGFGLIAKVGIESTGSYAAGITRFLVEAGVEVVEVNQPHLHPGARRGRNDEIDAEATARQALGGQATARAKVTTGGVESIGVLRLAGEFAVKSRTRTIVDLRSLLVTAPAALREQLTQRSAGALLA